MTYVVIALYFGVLLLIGSVASRRVHSLSDYYVGGKRLGYWVVAFSARATGESAWLYLGLTGLGALVGLPALWVVAGEVVGVLCGWFLMARPFKRATDASGSITIPDYLVSRFADGPSGTAWGTTLRWTAAGALAVFVTVYVSAQIDATGQAFNSFLSWNYYVGALVGFGIVVVYTLSGGYVAVAWSDLFQGSLMLVGLVLLPLGAMAALGGLGGAGTAVASLDPALLSVWGAGGPTFPNLLTTISYAAIGLGYLGSPQIFVRFISIRSEGEILAGRWVAVAFTLLTDTGAVLGGLLGRALLVGDTGDFATTLGASGEQVLPMLTVAVFPTIVVAVYIAAVLAATMSTIDSLLVVASSAVTHDVYRQNRGRLLSEAALASLSRRVTLTLALVALAVSTTVSLVAPDRTIFWYVIFGYSGIAATFCPMMILALAWPRYNAPGALASMVSGIVAIPLFTFGVPRIPVWGALLSRAEAFAPAFAVSLLAGVVVTIATTRSSQRSAQDDSVGPIGPIMNR